MFGRCCEGNTRQGLSLSVASSFVPCNFDCARAMLLSGWFGSLSREGREGVGIACFCACVTERVRGVVRLAGLSVGLLFA